MESALISIQQITTIIEASMKEVNAIIERTLKESREKQTLMIIQHAVQKIVPPVDFSSQKRGKQTSSLKVQQEVSPSQEGLKPNNQPKSKKATKQNKVINKSILETVSESPICNQEPLPRKRSLSPYCQFKASREKEMKESGIKMGAKAMTKKIRDEWEFSLSRETVKSVSKGKPKAAKPVKNDKPKQDFDYSYDVTRKRSAKKDVKKSCANVSFDASNSETLSFSEFNTVNPNAESKELEY